MSLCPSSYSAEPQIIISFSRSSINGHQKSNKGFIKCVDNVTQKSFCTFHQKFDVCPLTKSRQDKIKSSRLSRRTITIHKASRSIVTDSVVESDLTKNMLLSSYSYDYSLYVHNKNKKDENVVVEISVCQAHVKS